MLYLLIENNVNDVVNLKVLTAEQGHSDYSNSILQGRLQELGLEEVMIMGDGNCFFTAVAFHLLNLMSTHASTSVLMRSRIANIGLQQAMNMQQIADRLRELVVEEWRERADEYASFLPENVNYFAEVSKFENPGFFNSPLGDHMPKAISNVLGMPLCIVGSDPNTPVLQVSPSASTDSPVQIILAYNTSGPGHYNAAISKAQSLDKIQQDSTCNVELAGKCL